MNHQEKWDFYFSNVDDKPGSFYLDLGLAEVAPVHTMPYLICICLKMNDPREEDGLSSDREYGKLLEIEEHLFDSLKGKHDIIYAGRLASNGTREFYLYTGEALLLEKTLSESFVRFRITSVTLRSEKTKDGVVTLISSIPMANNYRVYSTEG